MSTKICGKKHPIERAYCTGAAPAMNRKTKRVEPHQGACNFRPWAELTAERQAQVEGKQRRSRGA